MRLRPNPQDLDVLSDRHDGHDLSVGKGEGEEDGGRPDVRPGIDDQRPGAIRVLPLDVGHYLAEAVEPAQVVLLLGERLRPVSACACGAMLPEADEKTIGADRLVAEAGEAASDHAALFS